MELLELHSPAKLNLSLTVLGKRSDGYHDIHTTIVPINFADRLRFTKRTEGGAQLIVRDIHPLDRPHFHSDERNLILRAVRLYERHYNFRADLTIEVDKKIPIGGGLGGGSSNAAATLKAMETLYTLGSTAEQLHAWGLHLGADVPFFLLGECAEATGIGDILTPISLYKGWWAVLFTPPYPIDTKAVYDRYRLTAYPSPVRFADCRSARAFFARLALAHNDLGAIAESLGPGLSAARLALKQHGAVAVLVSGSGASVYGIFDREPVGVIEELEQRLQGRFVICRPLGAETA